MTPVIVLTITPTSLEINRKQFKRLVSKAIDKMEHYPLYLLAGDTVHFAVHVNVTRHVSLTL